MNSCTKLIKKQTMKKSTITEHISHSCVRLNVYYTTHTDICCMRSLPFQFLASVFITGNICKSKLNVFLISIDWMEGRYYISFHKQCPDYTCACVWANYSASKHLMASNMLLRICGSIYTYILYIISFSFQSETSYVSLIIKRNCSHHNSRNKSRYTA